MLLQATRQYAWNQSLDAHDDVSITPEKRVRIETIGYNMTARVCKCLIFGKLCHGSAMLLTLPSTLTSADEIELAQDVVVTTLKSAFRTRGSQTIFAEKAGISPVYLSYILNQKRMPSVEMARRLSTCLPLSDQDRGAWLTYVEHYWQARRSLAYAVQQMAHEDVETALAGVLGVHQHAMYDTNPARVRQACELALSMGQALASVFPMKSFPMDYLELCSRIYELHCLVGQQVEALAIAKHVHFMAQLLQPPRPQDIDDFEIKRFNALRLEIVSLNQFGLYKEAHAKCLSLAADKALDRSAIVIKTMFYWDWMNSMAHLPRSSIREARHLTQEAWKTVERVNTAEWATEWGPLSHMLVSRSYAEVCISHGNYDEAAVVLRDESQAIDSDSIRHLGLLHRVMFMKTYARLLWRQPRRDVDQWLSVIQQAVHIAREAGLRNELSEIYQEYGPEIRDWRLGIDD